ncbi:MAG: hypothetical protein PHC94_00635 [Methylobacter sp.]|nr:hypothetical protein [Methylobacter sp.]
MRGLFWAVSIIYSILNLCPLALATDDSKKSIAVTVQHDPFKKPAMLQLQAGQSTVNSEQNINPGIAKARLTATLRGKDPMVILEGKSLRLGEMFEGYRLVEINERSAVFRKYKKQIILKIDNADEAN